MQIYINKNGQQLGPFDEGKVFQMVKSGQLSHDDYCIRQGEHNWTKVGEAFPQIKQNVPTTPAKPQEKSKGLMYGAIGCGGLILLGVVGLIGFMLFSKKAPNDSVVKNSNSGSNSASNSGNSTIKTPVITDFTPMKKIAEELASLSPAIKLDPNAKLKGKIAVVEKNADSEARLEGFDYEYKKINEIFLYRIKEQQIAQTPDAIDSVVQVVCKKGVAVGRYGGQIIAYANNCKVSLIDYRNKVVFAQKSFINNKPEKEIETSQKGGEYILSKPDGIYDYVEGFVPENIEISTSNAGELPILDDTKEFGSKAGEKLGIINFPLKLDENAKIKGKVTLIQSDFMNMLIGIDRDGKIQPPLPESIVLTKESVGFADQQLATKTSEIDTLIQVNCKDGSVITKIKGISVSSSICTVNIIDYKAIAIVAQKTFESKKINEKRYSDPSLYEDKKDTVEFPRAEIEEYIKQFPKA